MAKKIKNNQRVLKYLFSRYKGAFIHGNNLTVSLCIHYNINI